jgi:hypothetical protein
VARFEWPPKHDPQPSSAYIVHTDHLAKPSQFDTPEHWYTAMVASLSPASTSKRILYVYDTVMHGFAAELTDDEVRLLSGTPGVSGVYKDRLVHMHTTKSTGFLGSSYVSLQLQSNNLSLKTANWRACMKRKQNW